MKGRDERNSETGLEADWITVHEDWMETEDWKNRGGRKRERTKMKKKNRRRGKGRR